MRRLLVAAATVALLTLPAFAQNQAVGISGGVTQSLEDGLDTDFSANAFEVFYSADTDLGVDIKIKAGRVHADGGDFLGIADSPASVRVEYVDLLAEYRFWEPWGSSTIALGPGAYRVRHADLEDTQLGLSAAVAAQFPITRRLSFLADVAWHWVDAADRFSFLNVNGGLRFAF